MRKILLSVVMVLTAYTVSMQLSYAEQFSDGKEYKTIAQQPTTTGDKIEVLEFFWYGCPHCYHFEPFISKWLSKKPANVAFVRIPAVFRPDWKIHARTYYALQELGRLEQVHEKIFDEIHKNHKRLDTLEAMASFLKTQGIDKKAFTEAYNSFGIDSNMRKAVKTQAAYQINGVPTVIVNGKYMTSGSMTGTYDRLLDVVDYLVAKETKK